MAGAELLTAGGWFVSSVISKVANIVRDNYKLLNSKEDMVENLASNGSLLKSFVSTAERELIKHPVPNSNHKAWLDQLKDVLYKAEDVLDRIEYKKLCHRQQQGSKLISIPSSLKKLKNLIMIDDEIKELKDVVVKLHAMAQKKPSFDDLLRQDSQSVIDEETCEIFPESDKPIVGLEREMELIVNRLLAEDTNKLDTSENNRMNNCHGKPDLTVLCITGFAGVGKTALAQLVYNDQRIQHEFGLKLWVYVREISDARHVMNEIMIQTGFGYAKEKESLHYFQKELQKAIRGQKFLLVLYGVRIVVPKQWRALQVALRNGVDGCAILVTARNRAAADTLVARESQIIVDFLDEVNCRRLFEKCAIGGKKLPKGKLEELREIGSTICHQLHGLPSAVKILGRILNSNLDAECWKTTLSGNWWEHERLATEVLPSLLSNYLDLPPDLQQCFAYCSIFPKNYIFEKDRLVQMWIAQDYIQPIQNKRIEDIGRKWFDDLTDRFFFKRKGKEKFVMHDRVRDLAVYVSRDECFVAEHTSARPPQTVRHLSVTTNDVAIFYHLCYKNLRTILIFGKFEPTRFQSCMKKVCEESKSLRVLVTHSGLPPQSLKVNGGLLHLRYLGISSAKGNQLPGSICQLLHLQVLDLGDDNFSNLPQGLKNLINLRHLYADARTVSLITSIGSLTGLQELENFNVGSKDGQKIKELYSMNELSGRLCISNLGHVASKEEALQANLVNKIYLETIQLRDEVKEEILEGLQPHPNLTRLEIFGYTGKSFPRWMLEGLTHFTNLQSIHLNSHQNLIRLPPLGQIKKLKYLILESLGLAKVGDEIYGELDDAFPSLKGLTLARLGGLTEWKEWSEVKGRKFFPVLQELHILDCKDLQSVPNLSLISSLEELRIQKCETLSSPTHEYIDSLDSLRVVEISDNPHISSLHLSMQTTLERLTLLRCENIRLPNGFQYLNNLRVLHVSGCPGIKFSAMPKSDFQSLTYLLTDHCLFSKYGGKNLLQTMSSLQTLNFEGYQLHGITSDQDTWFEQLTSLQELNFSCCTKLERLPAKLVSCSSLKKLVIHSCQKIKSLPDNGLPYSLQELRIKQCPILGQRCQKTVGIDWPKISRIPNIRVDDLTIQKL